MDEIENLLGDVEELEKDTSVDDEDIDDEDIDDEDIDDEDEDIDDEDIDDEDIDDDDEDIDDDVAKNKIKKTPQQDEKALEILQDSIEQCISQEAKLETKIEQLQTSSKVDLTKFEDNLEDFLSEEEYELRLEDNPMAFIKAVDKAREKYIQDNTDTKELENTKDELKKIQLRKSQFVAIKGVKTIYPDFDFNECVQYFKNDLTGKQQDIIKSKTNVKEGLITLYKMMKKIPLKQTKAPNKPRVDSIKRRTAKGESIKKKEESNDYYAKIGLGR